MTAAGLARRPLSSADGRPPLRRLLRDAVVAHGVDESLGIPDGSPGDRRSAVAAVLQEGLVLQQTAQLAGQRGTVRSYGGQQVDGGAMVLIVGVALTVRAICYAPPSRSTRSGPRKVRACVFQEPIRGSPLSII
jgi:hypothetical protein